jgi:hypothetical protein
MKAHFRFSALPLLATITACAGHAYLPGDPGGAKVDLSGTDVRQAWVTGHPEVSEEIREGILEGVFVPGMTLEHRDVISNPDRRGSTGNAFWRSRDTGDEVRYQWFVASQWEPFHDGQGRLVCELVYVDGLLNDVRYCSAAAEVGDENS